MLRLPCVRPLNGTCGRPRAPLIRELYIFFDRFESYTVYVYFMIEAWPNRRRLYEPKGNPSRRPVSRRRHLLQPSCPRGNSAVLRTSFLPHLPTRPVAAMALATVAEISARTQVSAARAMISPWSTSPRLPLTARRSLTATGQAVPAALVAATGVAGSAG